MASSQPRQTRTPTPSSTPSPRRPSVSNSMHWLSRSPTTAHSIPSPAKPVRISEPRRVASKARSGTLGSGAIIVRTPEEALRETNIRLSPEPSDKPELASRPRPSLERKATSQLRKSDASVVDPISPTSPPLPPLPLSDTEEETLVSEGESSSGRKSPRRPTRPPPPLPIGQTSSRRSSIKGKTLSTAEDAPSVPPLPPHIVASTQPPPFQALLVSEPPTTALDPSKVIVTVETCTTTYKTTLSTIQSRPSHLASYFSTLFQNSDAYSPTLSRYSTDTDDLAMYTRHLTSQGFLPSSTNIHVFLDRPSAPYAHILNYLRSPIIKGQPETLPRALQIHSSASTQTRLENLIEVRDEAAFLNLEGLHKLCTDEIRLRYGPRLHSRGNSSSSASMHSLRASIHSMHTLLERVESEVDDTLVHSSDPTAPLRISKTDSSEAKPTRSPPTPDSWDEPLLEERSQSRQSQRKSNSIVKSAPAGWI